MATQKLGRNDPCWCGSGKKYKHCHLYRENETPLPPWEASKKFKQAFSIKTCLAPEAWKNECHGQISSAHTVPKGSLKQIARNGHVYSFIPSLEKLRKNHGLILPELLGINKASTITGFCSRHDNDIFSPLEKRTFSGTSEQCFLLGYRSLAREYYNKYAAVTSLNLFRDADKGQPPLKQFENQILMQANEIGLGASIQESNHYKLKYDSILESRDLITVRGYIIEFETPPPVMCSGGFFPEQDFDGVELQDLLDLSNIPALLCFTSFHGGQHGVVVFSWLQESDSTCRPFIESLDGIAAQYVTGALLRFFFTHCENIHMNPDWWERLPQEIQDALIRRFANSANPLLERPKAVLTDDGILYEPWTIVNRKSVCV